MVPPLEESEDGNRASFSRWEKRSVISNHLTELDLKITEIEMLSISAPQLIYPGLFPIINGISFTMLSARGSIMKKIRLIFKTNPTAFLLGFIFF